MQLLVKRPRRLRQSPILRDLVAETRLSRFDLIAPLFIKEGINEKKSIPAMPGIFQLPLKEAVLEACEIWKRGIRSVLLFGIPAHKDAQASSAHAKDGIIQKSIPAIKEKCPELFVMTDVCLCSSMDHGHCGLVTNEKEISNDATLSLLVQTALFHAQAGANMVAPSDMMDGRVGFIRRALDEAGFSNLPIMSYAVKYASSLYGPFRDAAESSPEFGDRKTYQMDGRNSREALREAQLDEAEGADILMIKPASFCLDIISQVASQTTLPIAAYQVSGEYSMIAAASERGFLDRKQVILESLTSIRRAGAKLIVTYFAKEVADYLA